MDSVLEAVRGNDKFWQLDPDEGLTPDHTGWGKGHALAAIQALARRLREEGICDGWKVCISQASALYKAGWRISGT
jgi:hypothetical protein